MMKFDTDKLAALMIRICIRLGKHIRFKTWQPGEKLKILLVGYNGKKNTGSDTRVESMARQFLHILGDENVEIGVVVFDEQVVDHYFPPPIKQQRISSIFFWPLLKVCSAYHLVVLSEGGCLKSKFSNSLLLYFLEGVGIAKKQRKPCLAYGVEAGYMDKFIYHMAAKICNKAYFITRTQQSLDLVGKMNLKGELGTDTAWIFNPSPKKWAVQELKQKVKWDARRPLVGVSVINPFCWPVKSDIKRYLKRDWRKNPNAHYKWWYFFSESAVRRQKFESYLSCIAKAVDAFAQKHAAHVVIFGMEALDLHPCQRLQQLMRTPAHIFSSCDYNGYEMTSLLRQLSLLVTSRYHARVLSMPAGVPSIAVSMDERLHNLLAESDHLRDYYLDTDSPHLESQLSQAMEKMWCNREDVCYEILNTIPAYLKTLADMGRTFRNLVKRDFPELPLAKAPDNWTGYLPPLYPELHQMIKK